MICFRDTTFCSSPGCVNACGRQLTREDRDEARRWWGSDNPPIAFAQFCDDAGDIRRERRSATRETGAQDD